MGFTNYVARVTMRGAGHIKTERERHQRYRADAN